MEMIPFECYVHTNAIMWRVMYRELRALMNDNEISLNPMEINDIYEVTLSPNPNPNPNPYPYPCPNKEVWNVGTLLQSEDSLSVLDDE
jgi:hypothetical protein